MPKKSIINRGKVKVMKLYQRIYNTIKANYPDAPPEVISARAVEGVLAHAEALGYFQGVWQGFYKFLQSKTNVAGYRNIMGNIRAAVIHIARLEMSGATDAEIENTIKGLGLPDDVKTAIQEYFMGAGTKKA